MIKKIISRIKCFFGIHTFKHFLLVEDFGTIMPHLTYMLARGSNGANIMLCNGCNKFKYTSRVEPTTLSKALIDIATSPVRNTTTK